MELPVLIVMESGSLVENPIRCGVFCYSAVLALPPVNTTENIAQFQIPEGTKIITGRVGPNFGYEGGGTQMYVLDPSVLQRLGG